MHHDNDVSQCDLHLFTWFSLDKNKYTNKFCSLEIVQLAFQYVYLWQTMQLSTLFNLDSFSEIVELLKNLALPISHKEFVWN